LRALPSNSCQGGLAPLGFPSFLGLWGQDFSPCPADTLRRDDRPPTHFFVKKKFSPVCGAETTTQKVPGMFCYAHSFCKEQRRNTLEIPRPSSEACKERKRLLRRTEFAQKLLCGAESTPHPGGSFFLYEKSVLRESDSLRGGGKEVCTDLTPTRSALKITGSKGI
jgi:hypothetical protein